MKQKKVSVLFFGRKDCDGTKAAIKHLERLNFDVICIISKFRGEQLPEDLHWWEGDYIFSFRSLFILPETLLKRARVAAINFHPGPPEYPGSGCVNFALYDECESYGVTAHLMNSKVDNGKILKCRKFPVHNADTLKSVLERTHLELRSLFLDFITELSKRSAPYIDECLRDASSIGWCSEARKISELDGMQEVTPDIDRQELDRVVRATFIDNYPPKLFLHGYEFVLSTDKKNG